MLELTEDLISKLNTAAEYWNEYCHNSSEDSDKIEKYFDCWCNKIYGIKVTVEEHSTTVGHRWCQWNKVEVLDEEKYSWFLLKF